MNWKDLMELVAIGQDEVGTRALQLGKAVTVDHNALVMLARMAIFQPDSEACMRSRVAGLIEDMVLRDPQAMAYGYEYKLLKAKRQAGTPEEKEESIMDNQNTSPAAPKSLPWYDDQEYR